MTDQFGQPPAQYPQQPTPGGMAPPPPPPPGTFPQPGGPQPGAPGPGYPQAGGPQPGYPQPAPPKKKRSGLIVGIILAVLLVCGLGACAIGVAVFSSDKSEKDIIAQAEKHFVAAEKAVETATESLKKASVDSPTSIDTAVTEATKSLRTGRDEIAASRAAAERLKDSQGKTDYLASLKAATDTLDALQDMVTYMQTASSMAAKALEGAAAAKAGNDALNNAIDAGNSSKYSKMASEGKKASANYSKSIAAFKAAHAIDPTAGLDKAALFADKRRQEADVVVRMAGEGKSGRLKAYNADIKKQAALSAAATKVGTPAIVSDPNWAKNRLAEVTTKVETLGKQADDLRLKALKELGVTE